MATTFVLGALHAILAAFDTPSSDCDSCAKSRKVYELEVNSRGTCRLCLHRDVAIHNMEVDGLYDYLSRPSKWGLDVLQSFCKDNGRFVEPSLSAAYRSAGFESEFFSPPVGSATNMSRFGEIVAKTIKEDPKSRTLWGYDISPFFAVNVVGNPSLEAKSSEESGPSSVQIDSLRVDIKGIVDFLVSKMDHLPVVLNRDCVREFSTQFLELARATGGENSPFERVEDSSVSTFIGLGRFDHGTRTAKGISVVIEKTVVPSLREEADDRLDLAKQAHSIYSDNEFGLSLEEKLNFVMFRPSAVSYPHYAETVMTRHFCCNQKNDLSFKYVKPGCMVHETLIDNGHVTRKNFASPLYGTNPNNKGSLALPGCPPLSWSQMGRMRVEGAKESLGYSATLWSYLTQSRQVVQQKIAGIHEAAMAILRSIHGEMIPEWAISQCRGLSREDAISAALSRQKPSGGGPVGFKPPVSEIPDKPHTPSDDVRAVLSEVKSLKSEIRKKTKEVKVLDTLGPPPPYPEKKLGKKAMPLKHKDPTVVQSVTSRFGTADFRRMIVLTRQAFGSGKYDVVKASKYFSEGKFRRPKDFDRVKREISLN